MLALLLGLAGCVGLSSGDGAIRKVLVHYLDSEGRHATGSSLLDRDQFQRRLRDNPKQIAAVRFDIKWGGTEGNATRLRVEVRGTQTNAFLMREAPVAPARFADSWTGIALTPAEFRALGSIESWRVSLMEGNRTLSEQASFLW